MVEQAERTPSSNPLIIRAAMGEIVLYDVTEDELNSLEAGTPSSIYLNFSLALITAFISFLIVILTVPINSNRSFVAFLSVTVISGIGGLITLFLWWRTKESVSVVAKRIRARKKDITKEAEVGPNTLQQTTPPGI